MSDYRTIKTTNGSGGIRSQGVATKNVADASTTQVIAHGLGKIPTLLKITAFAGVDQPTTITGLQSYGTYDGTNSNCIYQEWYYANSGYPSSNSTTASIKLGNSTLQTGVITWDSTNFTITWTKGSSANGTANILWEAEG